MYRAPRQLPGSPPAAATTISSETSFRELVSNTGNVNIILVLVLFPHSYNYSYVMYDPSKFGSQTENVDIVLVSVIYILYYAFGLGSEFAADMDQESRIMIL